MMIDFKNFTKKKKPLLQRAGKKLVDFIQNEHGRYNFNDRLNDYSGSMAARFGTEIGVGLHSEYKKKKGEQLFAPRSSGYKEQDLIDIKKKMGGDKSNFHYKEIQDKNQAWKATNDHDLHKLVSHLKKQDPEIHKKDTTPEFMKNLIHFSENSNKGDHLIMHSKDPNRAIVAHELGHTRPEGVMNHKIRNVLTHPATMVASLAAMSLVAPKNKNLRRALVAAPLLVAAPTLYEEARANYHARKNMKEIGMYDKEDKDTLKNSYKTYLKTVLLPAAVTSAANYAIHRKLSK